MKLTNHIIGFGSLITASFLYGFFGILTRIVGFHLPLFYQSWSRNLVGTIILLVIVWYGKSWKRIDSKSLIWMVARSLIGIFSFYCSFISFNFLPIGTAYFVYYAGFTMGGYLFGKLVFHEKITKMKAFSLVLSLIGLFLIYTLSISSSSLYPYIMMSFASGFFGVLWFVFSKKVSSTYSPLQLNFLDFGLTFVSTIILSGALREPWSMPTVSSIWIANGLFVVMFLCTGQLTVIGFKHIEATVGSLMLLMEVVFGIMFSYLYFHETLSLYTMIGGICIFISILLPEIYQLKGRKQ